MTDLRQAAQQALEALETLSKLGNGNSDGNSIGNTIAQEAREHLFTALAQPEQEPVPEKEWVYGTPLLDAMTQDYVPSQRPWVGLEIEEVQDSYNADYQAQTRAIEKLLKERNT